MDVVVDGEIQGGKRREAGRGLVRGGWFAAGWPCVGHVKCGGIDPPPSSAGSGKPEQSTMSLEPIYTSGGGDEKEGEANFSLGSRLTADSRDMPFELVSPFDGLRH